MAVGDVVSALSAVNTVLILLPAAGVEILITNTNAATGVAELRYWDGALQSRYIYNLNAAGEIMGTLKMWLKNGLGLRLSAIVGDMTAYSGIQTK